MRGTLQQFGVLLRRSGGAETADLAPEAAALDSDMTTTTAAISGSMAASAALLASATEADTSPLPCFKQAASSAEIEAMTEASIWPFFFCPVLSHDLNVLAVTAAVHATNARTARELVSLVALARLAQLLVELWQIGDFPGFLDLAVRHKTVTVSVLHI